jgi:rhodanese-related sulfurtransferase
MKKIIYSSLVVSLLSINLMAYDANKAEELNKFYSHMTQKACADSKLFIKADDVMKMLREKKEFFLLDVRTDGENDVLSLSGKNSLHVPINVLFKKENLDKLSTDKPIVVVCHSGTRATLAGIGLKRLGFKKVHVLKGGMVALAQANNPKNAPLK